MPLKGVRYVVTTKRGKKVRLAIRGERTVVEAKNITTGATHTPEEFARDRKRRRTRKRLADALRRGRKT